MDPKFDPANDGPIDFKSAIELEAPVETVREQDMEARGQEDGQKYGELIWNAVKKGIQEGQLVIETIEQEAIRTLEAQESATSVLLKQAKKFVNEEHDVEIDKKKKENEGAQDGARNATLKRNEAEAELEKTQKLIAEKQKMAVPEIVKVYRDALLVSKGEGEAKMAKLRESVAKIHSSVKAQQSVVEKELAIVDEASQGVDKTLTDEKQRLRTAQENIEKQIPEIEDRIDKVKDEMKTTKEQVVTHKTTLTDLVKASTEAIDKKAVLEQKKAEALKRKDKAEDEERAAKGLLDIMVQENGDGDGLEGIEQEKQAAISDYNNNKLLNAESQLKVTDLSQSLADKRSFLLEKGAELKAHETKLAQTKSDLEALRASTGASKEADAKSLATITTAIERIRSQSEDTDKRTEKYQMTLADNTKKYEDKEALNQVTESNTVKTQSNIIKEYKEVSETKAQIDEVEDSMTTTQGRLKEKKVVYEKDKSRATIVEAAMQETKTTFVCASFELKKATFEKSFGCKKSQDDGLMRSTKFKRDGEFALCPIACCVPQAFYKYGKRCPNQVCDVPDDPSALVKDRVIAGSEKVFFKRPTDKIDTCTSDKYTCEDRKRPGDATDPKKFIPLYDGMECAKYEVSVNDDNVAGETDCSSLREFNAEFKVSVLPQDVEVWKTACDNCQKNHESCEIPSTTDAESPSS